MGYKGPGDVVTVADREAQDVVRECIQRAFPDDAFVGEEGVPPAESEVAGRRRWYVDPLDGTMNFVKGRMPWAVSVAFCDSDDRLAAAAVAAPQYDEVLTASRNTGVRRNGRPLEPAVDLEVSEALGLLGPLGGLADVVEVMARSCLGVRVTGSTVSDLADLVCGRGGCYLGTRQGRWDLAAGILLAKEVGLVVSDLTGRPVEGPVDEAFIALPSVHEALGPELFEVAGRRPDR